MTATPTMHMAPTIRSVWFAVVASAMVAGGCRSSFDRSFDRLATVMADPGQPIVGAWQGSWSNDDHTAGGAARLIVVGRPGADHGRPSATTDEFTLELADFASPGAGRRFRAEAVVDPAAGPVRDFTAKVPAVVIDDLAAAALGLQARADGDAMTVQYWLTDALQQLDAGHISLRRAKPDAVAR